MYLLFDTETNGLPKNYKADHTNTDNWPRMIQIAWQIYDEKQKLVREENYLVDFSEYGVIILDDEAKAVHGFSEEEILQYGISTEVAIDRFSKAMQDADVIIGHNLNFDAHIIKAEMIRTENNQEVEIFDDRDHVCTMLESTMFCNIPGPYGPKWPKLQELHKKLFDEGFEDAHNAMIDVRATAKCFFALLNQGVINIK